MRAQPEPSRHDAAEPTAPRRPGEGPPARGARGRVVVRFLRENRLPTVALAFLLAGGIVWLVLRGTPWPDAVWMIGLIGTGAPVVWHTIQGMLRGQFAADIVASLAIVTAVILLDPLPGLVVVLMQTGGEALERYAEGRATQAVRALEAQAPRVAHRMRDEVVEDIAAEEVRVGDRLLIRPGELVPADGMVVDGESEVDASRLTGEPVPVEARRGVHLMSGSLNGDAPLVLRATAISRESQYAKIVELVRSAQASKSPLQRVADRYAVWFTPLTLAVAGGAWVFSGEVIRVLAVLVVATPCPLILATPVAIIGGINRAARQQIIMRNGTALEQMGKVEVGAFDKTGTLTVGLPDVERVAAVPPHTENDMLRLAGAIEQGSSHLLARTLVQEAERRGLRLPVPAHVREVPGRGIVGEAEGHKIVIGTASYARELVPLEAPAIEALEARSAALQAYVIVDGKIAGMVEYADRVRPGLAEFFDELKALGIHRTILLSGDRKANVDAVARAAGIDDARADLLPEGKVRIIKQLVADGTTVMMAGDGINDAPALSAATVGVALAGHGGGITAEAADVVILVDVLDRVADAVRISRYALHIALQSIWVGLGLSGAAMVFAALGFIPPTVGAFLQEGIDVAVILNALRASR